eukprot:CAMPEP_0168528160 /NCGR_PEP_ID=MMETSP0405-20121227/13081_1 /TAXON_ID=498012 /ORGANISM="Trichosphaerium sp, Strain Am-I-7 wt" /LENGTH=460 /DNA_ID=CAMNT_0008551507 /DNA_START=13 /DNA_END=1395 /DNA_ORIENTATION=+
MAEPQSIQKQDQTATEELKDFLLATHKEYDVFPTAEVPTAHFCASLHAPTFAEDARADVDICAVVDRSGSMGVKKMKLVKETLNFVSTQLTKADSFGVVSFDTGVRTDMELVKMTPSNKTTLKRKVSQIKAGSSTNLSGGLFKGLEELKATKVQNKVRSVWLLTDGLANHGISKSPALVKALKTKLEEQMNAQVFTFGYGDDHDEKMLRELAQAANGMYYYVENPDDIASSFADCLGGLLSVCAQNIKMSIIPENGCKVKKIMGKIKTEVKDGVHTLDLGDMYSEERRNVVAQFELPACGESEEFVVATYKTEFFNVMSCVNAVIEQKVVIKRKSELPKEQTRDYFMDVQINRIISSDAMEEGQVVGKSDLKKAQGIVDAAIKYVKESISASDALCIEMIEDLEEIRADMKDRVTYKNKASKKMQSKAMKHRRERGCGDRAGRGGYAISKKAEYHDKANQ